MKRIFALVLALAMVLSVSAFAGDTFNPNVAISEDGLTVTIQGSSIFEWAPKLTVKCTLPEAHVTHNGQVVESTLDTEKQLITFVVADVNGGDYVITAGAAPEPQPEPKEPAEPPMVVVVPKAYAVQSIDGVTASHRTAKKGTWVVLTVTDPAVVGISVTDGKGAAVELTQLKEGVYGFQMPGTPITVTKEYAPADPSLAFTDLDPNAWYHEAVNYVLEKGLMEGVGDARFLPGGDTSRAQIVTILWRLEGEPAVAAAVPFTDVPQAQWYTTAVAWAYENKIVNGISDTIYDPTAPVTRQQMAAILYRYAQYKGYDVTASADLGTYADAADVHGYAADAMKWACGAGLINGMGGALEPTGSAIRCQTAAILMRFLEQ